MKRKNRRPEQIVMLLREAQAKLAEGLTVEEVCRQIGISDATYRDSYQIEIVIPSDYPASPPTVKETGGAVPADFHRFPKTGNLCLAAPVELVRVFTQERTLRHYITRLLIPYLFSYTHFREHDQLPHGELSHGLVGLLEYYREFFDVGPVCAG